MSKLKISQVGNSLGVILPKRTIAHLKVAKGDELSCTETANGVELASYDPDFGKKVEAARRIARRYRNALKELAK